MEAIVQDDGHVRELEGASSKFTNNRIELPAALEALSFAANTPASSMSSLTLTCAYSHKRSVLICFLAGQLP